MPRSEKLLSYATLGHVLFGGGASMADPDGKSAPRTAADTGRVAMTTLGGRQFWTDVFAEAGWRIQENAVTGHFRLLDPDDGRLRWGRYDTCLGAFRSIARTKVLPWSGDHLVVMIHGLGRSRHSFATLAKALRHEGHATLAISYASTRGGPADHAARLKQLLSRLRGVDKVSFVSHSYGGLVLRQTLAAQSEWRREINIGRSVMLAPPAKGSAIADALQHLPAYRLLLGKGGQAVTSLQAAMVPPTEVPFGIIAGGRGDGQGFNPLLKGDNDGVVTVAETRLEGAADFLVVEALHTFIMDHPASVAAIRSFLRTGEFRPHGMTISR